MSLLSRHLFESTLVLLVSQIAFWHACSDPATVSVPYWDPEIEGKVKFGITSSILERYKNDLNTGLNSGDLDLQFSKVVTLHNIDDKGKKDGVRRIGGGGMFGGKNLHAPNRSSPLKLGAKVMEEDVEKNKFLPSLELTKCLEEFVMELMS